MIRFHEDIAPATNKVAAPATNTKPFRTANRRTREAFNAYQRDYMRRRRAAMKTAGTVEATR